MAAPRPDPAADARREAFRATMEGGETDQVRLRRFLRWIPTDPRCKACNAPFGMPGSLVSRSMGRRRWAKNPRFCDRCYTWLRDYGLSGVEITVTILFADVRDSTTLAEQVGPAEFRTRINRFYRIASDALLGTDGLVDKFIGDGVMGMYIPGMSGLDHASKGDRTPRGGSSNGSRMLPKRSGCRSGSASTRARRSSAQWATRPRSRTSRRSATR